MFKNIYDILAKWDEAITKNCRCAGSWIRSEVKRTGRKFGVQSQRGSALLVALLIMGILTILSMGLSQLVIGDVRQTVDVLDAGKAYYAAEGAVEKALLDLHQGLPGFETDEDGVEIVFGGEDESELKAKYRISNQTNIFPFRDPEESDLKAATPAFFYDELKLNESITIPLFSHDAKGAELMKGKDGATDNFGKFRVEYYVAFAGDLDKNLEDTGDVGNGLGWALTNDDVDVLRWKIFGINKTTKQTEALSDYFPVLRGSNAKGPMCLGPAATPEVTLNGDPLQTKCFTGGRGDLPDGRYAREYYENRGTAEDPDIVHFTKQPLVNEQTNGVDEFLKKRRAGTEFADVDDSEDMGLNGVINPELVGGVVGDETLVKEVVDEVEQNKVVSCGGSGRCLDHYPIDRFMDQHENVYITLTNIINPQIVKADDFETKKKIANIKYRLLVFPEENGAGSLVKKTAREFATVKVDGTYKGITQSIDAKIRMDQFLPVFNFSLYRTETGATEKTQ